MVSPGRARPDLGGVIFPVGLRSYCLVTPGLGLIVLPYEELKTDAWVDQAELCEEPLVWIPGNTIANGSPLGKIDTGTPRRSFCPPLEPKTCCPKLPLGLILFRGVIAVGLSEFLSDPAILPAQYSLPGENNARDLSGESRESFIL